MTSPTLEFSTLNVKYYYSNVLVRKTSLFNFELQFSIIQFERYYTLLDNKLQFESH